MSTLIIVLMHAFEQMQEKMKKRIFKCSWLWCLIKSFEAPQTFSVQTHTQQMTPKKRIFKHIWSRNHHIWIEVSYFYVVWTKWGYVSKDLTEVKKKRFVLANLQNKTKSIRTQIFFWNVLKYQTLTTCETFQTGMRPSRVLVEFFNIFVWKIRILQDWNFSTHDYFLFVL